MEDFWADMVLTGDGSPRMKSFDELKKVASLRPTIFIGAGGFGCGVVRKVKEKIYDLVPDESSRQGFAFIGLDTNPHDNRDILNNNSEFIELSIGVHPNTVASDRQYAEYLNWYRELVRKWSARNILSGADKVKAVGRLALLHPPTVGNFSQAFIRAEMQVRGFFKDFGGSIPKVYIISTLAGGTGSGILVDLFILTSMLLSRTGTTSHQLQAIVATPEALEGEARASDFVDFYANTYATMKEAFHFLRGEQETVKYAVTQINQNVAKQDDVPNPFFIVTDRNSKIVVRTLEELRDMLVSYLLFEIKTPLIAADGSPKPQDKENTAQTSFGRGDMPTSFSSLGVVQFGVPFDVVKALFADSIAYEALRKETNRFCTADEVATWINSNRLGEDGSDQLQETLRMDANNQILHFAIDTEGQLSGKKRTEMARECEAIFQRQEELVKAQMRRVIEENRERKVSSVQATLAALLENEIRGKSVGAVVAYLDTLLQVLGVHSEALNKELNEKLGKFPALREKVRTAISGVATAAASGILTRGTMIKNALGNFDSQIETFFKYQIVIWSEEEAALIYDQMISFCRDQLSKWETILKSLEGRAAFIKKRSEMFALEIEKMSNINERGPGNRFSIIDSCHAKAIFDEFIEPNAADMALRASRAWRENNLIYEITATEESWVEKAEDQIKQEISSLMGNLTILNILDRFYADPVRRDLLLQQVVELGSPLFPLDPNNAEQSYETSWVLAVKQELAADFLRLFKKYHKSGDAIQTAYFNDPFEVIIYSISHGYTIHSLSEIRNYKANYDLLQGKYEAALSRGLAHRPMHGWVNAQDWEELIPPTQDEQEALKLFSLGRAFSHLFPTGLGEDGLPDPQRNKAFIYNRGSYYYLEDRQEGSSEKLGNGLEESFANFCLHPVWWRPLENAIFNKIAAEGQAKVKNALENNYMPILGEEIGTAEQNGKTDRKKMLEAMRKTLTRFIAQELTTQRI